MWGWSLWILYGLSNGKQVQPKTLKCVKSGTKWNNSSQGDLLCRPGVGTRKSIDNVSCSYNCIWPIWERKFGKGQHGEGTLNEMFVFPFGYKILLGSVWTRELMNNALGWTKFSKMFRWEFSTTIRPKGLLILRLSF